MPKFKENKKKRKTVKKTRVEMLTAGVSVMHIAALKGLCILLIGSLHYNILFPLSELFLNVDGIIYFLLCNKHQVPKGCKAQVNTQLLISKDMTWCFK